MLGLQVIKLVKIFGLISEFHNLTFQYMSTYSGVIIVITYCFVNVFYGSIIFEVDTMTK